MPYPKRKIGCSSIMQAPIDETTEPESTKDSRAWRWVSVSYFAEGLPWSLLHQVSAEYFTSIGARPAQVGWTALLHIPILLKVIFSPVVEGYATLRRWMVGTQAIIGVLAGGVALCADRIARAAHPTSADSTLLWVLLFSIGIASAIYDIACDGFYLEHLNQKQQARFSGIRVAVYRAAMLLGSFLLVFLGGAHSWLLGFGLGAGLLLGLALALQRLLPPSWERGDQAPTIRKRGAGGSEAFRTFFQQDAWWLVLAFLLSYKAADGLKFSMSSVLLSRHLGIGTELRATIGVFSTVAGILGSIWGGTWIARRGLAQALFPITVLMVMSEPLFALMAAAANTLALPNVDDASLEVWWTHAPRLGVVTLILVIEKLCAGLAVTAQTVFIMRRCHPAHKTAHYAFATVIYSISQIVLGLSSGYLFEAVGPLNYYILVSVLALPALILVRYVPLQQRLQ